MNGIKNWLLSVIVHKYCLGYLVQVWHFAEGYRTQLGVTGACIALALGYLQVIPNDKAYEIAQTLGGVAMASFLEKLRRYSGLIKSSQEMLAEAEKGR